MAKLPAPIGMQGKGKRPRSPDPSSTKGDLSPLSQIGAAKVISQPLKRASQTEQSARHIDDCCSTEDVELCAFNSLAGSKPQYTDGPVRFIITNDGAKGVLALLMTDQLIHHLNKLTRLKRDLKEKEKKSEKMAFDIESLERALQNLKKQLENKDSNKKLQLDAELEECKSKLTETHQIRDVLDRRILFDKDNLSFARESCHEFFEEAMEEANLLEAPPSPADEDVLQDSKQQLPTFRPDYQTSEKRDLSEKERLQQDARQECVASRMRAADIQRDFDDIPMKYHENLALYEQDQADGDDVSRSEFDRMNIRYGQAVTRALMEAESQYDKAKERAEAICAFDDESDNKSYYGESQCSGRTAFPTDGPELPDDVFLSPKRRKVIASWSENVGVAKATSLARTPEVDEWIARPVEVSDSISVVASGREKKKIESWRAKCKR